MIDADVRKVEGSQMEEEHMIIFLKMARGHCLSSKLRDCSTNFYDGARVFSTRLELNTDTSYLKTVRANINEV